MGPIQNYVAFDTETTGTGEDAKIIEIALIQFIEGEPAESWHTMIWPPGVDWNSELVAKALEVNGLTMADLLGKPVFEDVFPTIMQMLSLEPVWVAHNAKFDLRMLKQERAALGRNTDGQVPRPTFIADTMLLDFALVPGFHKRRLDAVAPRWGITRETTHRALDDALDCGRIFAKMAPKLPMSLEALRGMQSQADIEWTEICERAAARDAAKKAGVR